jgi:ferredoxin
MSYLITDECINCGACEPECPNNAIYNAGEEWSFADSTTITGQIEYNGRMVDAQTKFAALSDNLFYIVPEKCTECAGFHDDPQCVAVCPVDCCVEDPNYRESREELMDRKTKLHP